MNLFSLKKIRGELNSKELLAIRRIFSLVDMITNTKFSNCPNAFKIDVVWQLNMHSRQQNTFQSDSPFTIPCKRALSTPTPHLTLLYWAPFRPDFQRMHCEFKKKIKC